MKKENKKYHIFAGSVNRFHVSWDPVSEVNVRKWSGGGDRALGFSAIR